MNNDISLIQSWIFGLIIQKVNYDIIHPSFLREDGMSLTEYITYEQKQFDDLSDIYDLTTDFTIEVLNKYVIEKNNQYIKYGYFIYLINHLNKIVCKMNLTLIKESDRFFLGSNNFFSQLVPKYSLNCYYNQKSNTHNTDITHIALAIHSPLVVKSIISQNLPFATFNKGNNYEQDGFYYAQFLIDKNEEILFNSFYNFYLTIIDENGKEFIEKRKIFFDSFEDNLIPFEVTSSQLNILNESYPVHISYWKEHENFNQEYPRNLHITLEGIQEVIITDSIDNDWKIIFEG